MGDYQALSMVLLCLLAVSTDATETLRVNLPRASQVRVVPDDYVLPYVRADIETDALNRHHPARLNSQGMVVLDESQMIGIVVEDQSVALNDLEWLDEIPTDRLKSLVLSVNRVSEAGSKRLRKFVGLQQLVVYCDDVEVKAIAEGCPDLQRLELYSLNLRLPVDGPQGDAFSDESFKHMSVLKDLRCVRMRGRDIGDDALIQISKYPKIEAVEIVGTGKLTDDGLKAVSTATNLREISIQGSEGIGDKGILALKTLKQLELLMIRGKTSASEDAFVELKAALPKLTVKQLPLDRRGVR